MSRDGRHSRQLILPEIGHAGQARLELARALIVGAGALGSAIAERLARAGVGTLRVFDDDVVSESNLQRQTLYVDADVAARRPKVEVLAERLRAIDPGLRIEPHVTRLTADNALGALDGVELVLDATDNFEARFLINDACLETATPWVYGGVVGTTGMSLTVIPGNGPCLRCLVRDLPEPGALPTVHEVGILNTLPFVIASVQATEAIKLLLDPAATRRGLLHLDLWTNTFETIRLDRDPSCPACGLGEREFLTSPT
jgi:molybdopterin-synthase adenylyltransferase